MITDYQERDGTVDTSTSLKVQHGYGDASGGNNKIRSTSLTYPSGRKINYGYATSGSLDDKLNRLKTIKDGSTTLASYQYLGQYLGLAGGCVGFWGGWGCVA